MPLYKKGPWAPGPFGPGALGFIGSFRSGVGWGGVGLGRPWARPFRDGSQAFGPKGNSNFGTLNPTA